MRSRWAAAIGSGAFFAVAPFVVAGLIPPWITGWRMSPPLLGWSGMRWLGIALIGAGAVALVDAFARFVRQGRGTPAPVLPTETLVISGPYRHVRNPMYIAVVAVIVGQALLLGTPRLLGYALLVGLAFQLFVLTYEEPTLRRQFGAQYDRYCQGVRRWWPRITPWSSTGG